MTTLTQYIEENRTSKKNRPTDEHAQRWESRITPLQWHQQGEAGANLYLASKWAKGIGSGKCIALARFAEDQGYKEFALGFWIKAFEIDYPGAEVSRLFLPVSAATAKNAGAGSKRVLKADDVARGQAASEFPDGFQPGRLAPMQPVDAVHSRAWYCADPKYWGQPKRDGEKLIVFVTATGITYQSRSMKLQGPPIGIDKDFEPELIKYAAQFGAYILEGEAFYLSHDGKEFMSWVTCNNYNQDKCWSYGPIFRFEPFACLYHNGPILRQYERVETGCAIANMLSLETKSIQAIHTAKTAKEKFDLCALQVVSKKEGEVWFDHGCHYKAGKSNDERIVRTVYLTPPTTYYIKAVAPSKAAGHFIGGFEVEDGDGVSYGSVGTGYSRAQQKEILERFTVEGPGHVRVIIVSKGFTPYGQLRLGVFQDFA